MIDLAERWKQTRGEEIANALSHAVGLIAASLGAPILLWCAYQRGSPAFFVGASIFAATMLLLYLGSTIYHFWPRTPFKAALQVVDHSAIFLLIAGTYTPFALGPLQGLEGWTVLALIWLIAVAGIVLKLTKGVLHRPRLAVAMYLGMGWLVLLVIRPLALVLPTESLWCLTAGGLCYTLGVYFFLRDDKRYRHFIWHLFVLGGTASHYLAVLAYAA
jgi:hemolysin III